MLLSKVIAWTSDIPCQIMLLTMAWPSYLQGQTWVVPANPSKECMVTLTSCQIDIYVFITVYKWTYFILIIVVDAGYLGDLLSVKKAGYA